jgi:hypothetical protein
MSSNFPQSGQLDWGNLSRATGTFSLEVFARLAKADVELATIGVGNAICSGFSFPAQGQLELSKSLAHLKGTSSFSRAVWFGFGVKHVVRSLSETEQGAMCVAICAALAIPNTSFQAAQILRDLCEVQGAPSILSPSIHQWVNLIEVCGGALTKSKFGKYFEGFVRILVQSRDPPKAPTPSGDVAKALVLLGQLSKRTLVSATFVGGMSCAWLAAVAQCLLCLNIEIRDENGKVIYKTMTEPEAPIHATFISESRFNEQSFSGALTQRTCFVSSGEELLHERVDLTNSPYRGPTRWARVLSDTFPELTSPSPPLVKALNFLLGYVAGQSEQYFSAQSMIAIDTDALPWLNWKGYGCLYHPRCTGLNFLKYAKRLFPELSFCGEIVPQPAKNPVQDFVECLEELSRSCSCDRCCTRKGGSQSGLLLSQCSIRVAVTIMRLLLILAPVVVHEDIPPSISALKQLYNCSPGLHESSKVSTIPYQGLALVLFIFSGRFPSSQMYPHISAASTAGVCVYYSLLKDINLSPSEAMDIEVIPGHIKHRAHLYNFIIDADARSSQSFRGWTLPYLSPDGVVLIAEEVEDNKALAASYRVTDPGDTSTWFSVGTVVDALRSFIRTNIRCSDNCAASSGPGSPTCNWPFQSFIVPTEEPNDKKDTLSVENSQFPCWSVMAWESWGLPRVNGGPHQHLEILISRPEPVLLFSILIQLSESYSKFPFKHKRNRIIISEIDSCHSCRVRLACWMWSKIDSTPVDSRTVPFDHKGKRGSIREQHPGGTESEIKFELIPAEPSSTLSNKVFKWFRRSLDVTGLEKTDI